MRRWFLSFNSSDRALAERLKAEIERKDSGSRVFFDATSLRAGGYWQPALAKGIDEADAFVLLVGEKGLGPWQTLEYYEAHDKHVKSPEFPVVLMLLDGQAAPGLPFLRQLHWIISADPTSEKDIARLIDAAAGTGARPGELWRYTSPYRGLSAMEEKDADYFFGRGRETVEVLNVLASAPDKLPVLLGNSGVGKSSLAQAGVLAALARQAWPERAVDAGPWPQVFENSRQWCFLALRPGAEPIKALVETFLDKWQFDAGDPTRIGQRNEWVKLLLDDNRETTLSDLLDETERRQKELTQAKPPGFFLYIDQGEELYVRAEPRQGRRFSEIIAQGLCDPRLRALMSIRSDFLGGLQVDEPLFAVHRKIDVPPLREAQLCEVVSRPAAFLSARFETDTLAADIARRAAEESTKDAGALPLLSYLLDDMWTHMVQRGDRTLRLPAAAIEFGGVLAERADAFLARHPESEGALRCLLTLNLATVREDGEPTRRRAARSELTDDEWRLVSELADHPNRLLVTATAEGGETYAEVAHEAIFRRWNKLREWIAGEREFLAWRTGLEAARRAWDAAPEDAKVDAVLMGLPLTQASNWLSKRGADIPEAEERFIVASHKAARRRGQRVKALIGALVGLLALVGMGWWRQDFLREQYYWHRTMGPSVLTAAQEKAAEPGSELTECATGCPTMVVVPAGNFMMGSPEDDKNRSDDEGPQHEVTIATPFAVGKTEVTFAEWDACVAAGACPNARDNNWGHGDQPVINVSWNDAKQYVAWLSRITGKEYRLLTEAEWEYAARAGTTTVYSWGNEIGTGNANCDGCSSRWDKRQTAPVRSFKPNAFGLYDMHGNVVEWVEDTSHDSYDGAPTDGSAWVKDGDVRLRVVRGGSVADPPPNLRAAFRGGTDTDFQYSNLGFRLARTFNSLIFSLKK